MGLGDVYKRQEEAGAIVRHEYMQGKGNVIRRMFREIDAKAYISIYEVADVLSGDRE